MRWPWHTVASRLIKSCKVSLIMATKGEVLMTPCTIQKAHFRYNGTRRCFRDASLSKAKAGPQSMFDAFKKWSFSGHTFTFIKLTPAEVESLGVATRQFIEKGEEGGREVMVRGSEALRPLNTTCVIAKELAAFPGRLSRIIAL